MPSRSDVADFDWGMGGGGPYPIPSCGGRRDCEGREGYAYEEALNARWSSESERDGDLVRGVPG